MTTPKGNPYDHNSASNNKAKWGVDSLLLAIRTSIECTCTQNPAGTPDVFNT
jgi:hypothetical protein